MAAGMSCRGALVNLAGKIKSWIGCSGSIGPPGMPAGKREGGGRRGHGHGAVGPSLRVAVFRACYAEFNARLQAQAMSLGGSITYVEGDEAVKADQTMQRVDQRPWALWKASAKAKSAARATQPKVRRRAR